MTMFHKFTYNRGKVTVCGAEMRWTQVLFLRVFKQNSASTEADLSFKYEC